ncbi:BamA/TamA family outer membrane protein [Saccharicrinis aurantiacus]|uniref:BamA/TamA family outer membrane protein n=1 Tax=Saccharicrinis aurantiacus TaxID=1849719 RepID=UPI00094FF02F|nr:BamA/TamA family outer membrane protein [Saccharicrinis aurantiacus]
MNKIKTLSLLIIILITSGIQAQNDSITSPSKKKGKISMRDPVDNSFDLSSFLLEHRGLLPVPMIITEPAVGYGGGGALLYFHTRKKEYKTYVPPNVSGIAGFGTENKTWGAGAFHSHIFGENRVRTITAVFKPDVWINYYGNNNPILSKNPINLNMDAWLIYQSVQYRLSTSKFYIGASYLYFNNQMRIDTIPGKPLVNEIIKRLEKKSVISTLKPMIEYDSRDNVFTPTKGIDAILAYNYSAKWLGADEDYGVIDTDIKGFVPFGDKTYSTWKFTGSYLVGDAPFYAYPFIQMRGIPAMRYQSDNVMVAETEWRYNVYKRWSLVGFTGAGKAFQSFDTFEEIDWAYTIGTGFRYEIARMLGVHMGTDFAWGNGEDFAFYIVFGSSF